LEVSLSRALNSELTFRLMDSKLMSELKFHLIAIQEYIKLTAMDP